MAGAGMAGAGVTAAVVAEPASVVVVVAAALGWEDTVAHAWVAIVAAAR